MKSLRLWRMRRSFLRLSRWRGCVFSDRRAGDVILRWRGCAFSGRRTGTFVRAGAAAAVRPPLNAAAGYHMMVNCAPAKCFCLPDLVPAQAFVRAGNGERKSGMRGMSAVGIAVLAGRFASVRAFGLAPLAGWFALGARVRACDSGGVLVLGSRAALRLYRCVLPQFMPELATLASVPSIRARPCGSSAAFCLSLCPGLRLWLGCCHRFARSGLRFWRSACPRFARGDAVLLSRFALGLRAALRFYCGVLPRFTPAVCRLAPNRTACGILRSCSAGSRSPLVRSRGALRLSAFVVSLRDCAFYLRRSRRGCRGRWVTGAGGAAYVRFYASALALLCFPRGVRWG